MHWARVPVVHMLSVLARKPLSSGHVGGRLPAVARFWTTVRMVVRKVVGDCWVVVVVLSVAVSAGVGAVVIGGRVAVVMK